MDYLLALSLFAGVCTVIVLSYLIYSKEWTLFLKAGIIGFLIAGLDLIVEYLGTTNGFWKYNNSLWFLFGHVPIELMILFFSVGFVGVIVYANAHKVKQRLPLKSNYLLYISMLALVTIFLHNLFMYGQWNDVVLIAIPIGLWGLLNVKPEHREPVIFFAVIIFVIDFVLEILITKSGSYGYTNGFQLSTPMFYSLMLIGGCGLFERMNKLDDFLEAKVVSKILKAVGIIDNRINGDSE